MKIRAAQLSDAGDLAAFHVRIWRETYRDMAPKAAYEQLNEARRLPAWQSLLAQDRAQSGAFVAEDLGQLGALISFARATDPLPEHLMEITHLYVCDSQRGKGLGRRMLHTALDHLKPHRGVCLAVVAENENARRFYARLGGTEAARFSDKGPLWKSDNIRIDWPATPA